MGVIGKVIGTLFVLLAGFVLGHHMGSTSHTSSPLVTVKFVNDSGKGISSMRLIHNEGMAEARELADGGNYTVGFYAPRETSYKLEVAFDDGKFIEAGPRFVDSGLVATETVKELEIVPDFKVKGIPR